MKYNEKQYAQALHDMTRDKSRNEIKSIIGSFIDLLSMNNDLAKTDKIIDKFSAISDHQAGLLSAEVKSARELSGETVSLIKRLIIGRTNAKEVAIDAKIDDLLLGGAVIKYADRILDISLKSKLLNLRKEMIK